MRIAKPICSFAARARAQSLKSPQRAWPRCLYRSRMRLTIIRRATRLFYPNAAQRRWCSRANCRPHFWRTGFARIRAHGFWKWQRRRARLPCRARLNAWRRSALKSLRAVERPDETRCQAFTFCRHRRLRHEWHRRSAAESGLPRQRLRFDWQYGNRTADPPGRARAPESGRAARADACRTDALKAGHCGGRHARQNHHDQPDCERAGRRRPDPTFVIGGRLNSAGANARLGAGEFIVVETDESDALFLTLSPVIEVITNIDADHMERYAYDFAQLKQAFIDFTQRLPFYGIAVLCIDDPHVRDILPGVSNKQIVRYGLAEDAQVRAVNVRVEGARMRFSVLRQNGAPAAPLEVELNLPGLHNVRNALAAIAVASELEVADEAILGALARFTGVDRRFQRYGEIPAAEGGHYTLIDDYGHHPAEIAATLAAARAAFDGRRLVLAFQPHRYTRTRDCFDDLVKALSSVDALVLTEVYSAGETPLIAADVHALARAVRVAGKVEPLFVETVEEIPEAVMRIARDGDVVITMGAGSMGGVAAQLKQHTLEMKKRDVFNPS